MCGIFGIVDFNGISGKDENLMNNASKVMLSRGPDFQGFYKDDCAYLGHNRLKILDLSHSANQPFVFEERYIIVFNGEIYNFKEIRKQLEKNGVTFNTHSDTEVLVAGYSRHKEQIVPMLRGMWAFVIWDKAEKKIFASRDRFGEKPFYYSLANNRLVFASNLGGINKLTVNTGMNYNAIAELIGAGFISSNRSILNNISKLKAAHNISYTSAGFSINRYWNIDYSNKIEISFDETINAVEALLQNSVEEKLEADVEVGLFLSSGIDSALIAAMASNGTKKIKTITMAASDAAMDESGVAQKIAAHLGLENEIVKEDTNYFAVLNEMYAGIEPLADSSILPSFSVSKAARSKFRVVLTGDGGDEIFGGYTNSLKALDCNSDNTMLSPLFDFCIDNKFNPEFSFLNRISSTRRIFKYSGFISFLKRKDQLSDYIKKNIFTSEAINKIILTKAECFIQDYESYGNINYHDKVLLNGINTTLADDFLYKMDSATMANSIESRSPFLDHRLIEFTSHLKSSGLMPNKIEKEITKTLAYKYIPADILNIPKRGFSVPVKSYFKGSWANMLLEKLQGEEIKELKLFNITGIENLLINYRKNQHDQLEKVFFAILSFIIWFESFGKD